MMNAEEYGYITDIEYTRQFYPNLSPTLLRYAATINQVFPPRENNFRYLELGCGLGRSLSILAAANPDGDFVGVDFNENHTHAANQDISSGELQNVQIITSDFGCLNAALGQFDFIVLHGVFSWVSDEVRRQILTLASMCLASKGLLLVSYNAMPGWSHLRPIRDLISEFTTMQPSNSATQVKEALHHLINLRDKKAQYFIDNPAASTYLDFLLRQDIRYLAHEFLNKNWQSFYFNEVSDFFAQAKMTYVGSLPLASNYWNLSVRNNFRSLFGNLNRRDLIESNKDFCANTTFRWDIYSTNQKRMETLDDRLKHADNFYYSCRQDCIAAPFEASLGIITVQASGPIHEYLKRLLVNKSWHLSEILGHKNLKQFNKLELINMLDTGVAIGLYEISRKPLRSIPIPFPKMVSMPAKLNQYLIRQVPDINLKPAIASPITGTGHFLEHSDASALRQILDNEPGFLAKGLKAVDSNINDDQRNNSVNHPTNPDNDGVVTDIQEQLRDGALLQLYRLGIIDATDS